MRGRGSNRSTHRLPPLPWGDFGTGTLARGSEVFGSRYCVQGTWGGGGGGGGGRGGGGRGRGRAGGGRARTKSPGRNTATQTPQTPDPVYLYPSPPRGGEGVCGAITTPPPHFPAAREERIFERPQHWTPTAKVPPALASIVAAPLVHCTACRSHTKRQAPTAAA
jgi:hypothetical protein